MDALTILNSLAKFMPHLSQVISVCAVAFGIYLVFNGFRGLWRCYNNNGQHTHHKQSTPKAYMLSMLLGALLTSQDWLLVTAANTFYGGTGSNAFTLNASAFAYHTNGFNADTLQAYTSVMMAFMLVGKFSFFRGMFLLNDIALGQSNSSKGTAVTYIVAGVFLATMDIWLEFLSALLGFQITSLIFMNNTSGFVWGP